MGNSGLLALPLRERAGANGKARQETRRFLDANFPLSPDPSPSGGEGSKSSRH